MKRLKKDSDTKGKKVPEVVKTTKVTKVAKKEEIKVEKIWRFYRSHLPTIVWDARGGQNKAMADFSKGYFTTKEEEVADILRSKGYLEIPLNMTEPPAVIINQPSPQLLSKHVPLMPGAGNISGEAAEIAANRMMEKVLSIPEVQTQ